MASAQRNKGADATPQREEKRTDATPQREEKQTERRRRYELNRDTPTETISMYPYRWASCHIQYTYNSSHKINLFSLQLKINN